MSEHDRLLNIMSGTDRSMGGAAGRLGLSLLEPGYRLAVAVRNGMFNSGMRSGTRLPRPTISVGNVTVGGTGKTPMVVELVRRLADLHEHPAVLMRGYGGDEVVELRRTLAAVEQGHGAIPIPVEANPNRIEQAKELIGRRPDVSVFVLDDGFQHRQVQRDLDLALVDATRPFGFEHVLPRGLLREPKRNLRRADAVIITRSDQVSADELAKLDAEVQRLTGKPPIAHARNQWAQLRCGEDRRWTIADLKAKKVFGACGIGNPGPFCRMLKQAAGEVLACRAFADHQRYTADLLLAFLDEAKQAGAEAVVTTEKDWVKWQPLLASKEPAVPVLRPELQVRFLDGSDAIDTLLRKTVQPHKENGT